MSKARKASDNRRTMQRSTGKISRTGTGRNRQWSGTRRGVPANVRLAILNRDGWACTQCGHADETGTTLVIDHRIPVSQGGTDVHENLRVLCEYVIEGERRGCHSIKTRAESQAGLAAHRARLRLDQEAHPFDSSEWIKNENESPGQDHDRQDPHPR